MTAELSEGFPKVMTTGFEVTPDEKHLARLTICKSAIDVEDALRLMDILGIAPNQVDPLSIERRSQEKRNKRKELIRSTTQKKKIGEPLNEEEIEFLNSK